MRRFRFFEGVISISMIMIIKIIIVSSSIIILIVTTMMVRIMAITMILSLKREWKRRETGEVDRENSCVSVRDVCVSDEGMREALRQEMRRQGKYKDAVLRRACESNAEDAEAESAREQNVGRRDK